MNKKAARVLDSGSPIPQLAWSITAGDISIYNVQQAYYIPYSWDIAFPTLTGSLSHLANLDPS
jgi:hypothetical protein